MQARGADQHRNMDALQGYASGIVTIPPARADRIPIADDVA